MSRTTPSVEALVRQAFGLLLEIRSQPEAKPRLEQAIAFLKMLVESPATVSPPLVVSIRAVRIRGS
ncbi:MAG: hypothetical protein LAO07_16615 [Acidobacteriia bacterium]|nr:hypothetical protein [Terriglobia bacterium]